jgi:ferrochelatase
VAMRYWHPLTDAVMEQIRNDGCDRIVLLPLYPHYSRSTTGSSVNEWNRILRRRGWTNMAAEVVEQYCDHPSYVNALVRNIGFAIRRVPEQDRGKINLVFSAHGTPMKLVQSGDPYQQQIIRTYEAVLAAGKFGLRHHLCYQSKVGPQRWLEPSLTGTIERLAAEKVTHVIAIPIAFVSDHSETLVEINMEAKEQAKHLGIRYFDMSPALNASPLFIDALADLIRKKVGV